MSDAKFLKKWLREDKRTKRHYRLMEKYGISLEAYETLRDIQSGRCAICEKKEERAGRYHLSVDHNHKNGKIRGLLCHRCNVMLGLALEEIATLKSAISYLEKHVQ